MIVCCIAILLSGASSFSPSSPRHHVRIKPHAAPTSATTALPASLSPLTVLNDTAVDGEATGLSSWDSDLAFQRMQELADLSASPTLAAADAPADAQSFLEASPTIAAAEDMASTTAADDTHSFLPDLQSASTLAHAAAAETERARLKRELARVSITGYCSDADVSECDAEEGKTPRTAEDIMKELERMDPLPIISPATHHSLNADWAFVFTGVPTIGMRLITLLSRMSVLFPFEILDFRDVALCVTDGQSRAKAVVDVKVCGVCELLLEVCTSLRRPTAEDLEGEYKDFKGEQGTLLLEHFQGITLNGVEIPTPESWRTTRTLDITYMDKDIMVARTGGGEPHLLLRNSPLCYTSEEMVAHGDDAAMADDVELCDLDGPAWTEFFGDALEMYGDRITRCLVDRDFGREEFQRKEQIKNEGKWKGILANLGSGDKED
ncbi:hypothetical protein ACHAXT_001588 [Thalassiosira profunda]